jgi:hypothetical protein
MPWLCEALTAKATRRKAQALMQAALAVRVI